MHKCKKHRFPLQGHESFRSIGSVKIYRCDNCLTVKIVQQRATGWTKRDKPVETIVELDSAYPGTP